MIEIVIPGPPRPQPRVRALGFRRGDGKLTARVYQDKTAARWKERAAMIMKMAIGNTTLGGPMQGPVYLEIDAIWPRVQSRDKARKESRGARLWRPRAGDADNVAKAVMDAGNKVLWEDDRQVVKLTVRKLEAAEHESPCVMLRCGFVTEENL